MCGGHGVCSCSAALCIAGRNFKKKKKKGQEVQLFQCWGGNLTLGA